MQSNLRRSIVMSYRLRNAINVKDRVHVAISRGHDAVMPFCVGNAPGAARTAGKGKYQHVLEFWIRNSDAVVHRLTAPVATLVDDEIITERLLTFHHEFNRHLVGQSKRRRIGDNTITVTGSGEIEGLAHFSSRKSRLAHE